MLDVLAFAVLATAGYAYYQRVVKKEPIGIALLDDMADAVFGRLEDGDGGAQAVPPPSKSRAQQSTATRSRAQTVATARARTSVREAGTTTPPHHKGRAISTDTPARGEYVATPATPALLTCVSEPDDGSVNVDMAVYDALNAVTPVVPERRSNDERGRKRGPRPATRKDEDETVTGAVPSVRPHLEHARASESIAIAATAVEGSLDVNKSATTPIFLGADYNPAAVEKPKKHHHHTQHRSRPRLAALPGTEEEGGGGRHERRHHTRHRSRDQQRERDSNQPSNDAVMDEKQAGMRA